MKIDGGNNHCHHARRRLVVEITNSWHNRFRKLLVRYEKKLKLFCVSSMFRLVLLPIRE